MSDTFYTHGTWQVKPGKEAQFIETWKALSDVFIALPNPPGVGTLIQSVTDPSLFYSFGPWNSLADIQAMRTDSNAAAALQSLRDLCEDSLAGPYRLVLQVGYK